MSQNQEIQNLKNRVVELEKVIEEKDKEIDLLRSPMCVRCPNCNGANLGQMMEGTLFCMDCSTIFAPQMSCPTIGEMVDELDEEFMENMEDDTIDDEIDYDFEEESDEDQI